MRGVFILVGVGIIGGIFLICVEIIFKKHQKRLKLKDSMAKTAVRKWRGNVEVCTYFTYLPIYLLTYKFCSSNSSSQLFQKSRVEVTCHPLGTRSEEIKIIKGLS